MEQEILSEVVAAFGEGFGRAWGRAMSPATLIRLISVPGEHVASVGSTTDASRMLQDAVARQTLLVRQGAWGTTVYDSCGWPLAHLILIQTILTTKHFASFGLKESVEVEGLLGFL